MQVDRIMQSGGNQSRFLGNPMTRLPEIASRAQELLQSRQRWDDSK